MKIPATILQTAIVLVGIGALALLLGEPLIEGRNAHAALFQVYFNDPFLIYAYVSSISVFVALHQAFTVLGYARQNRIFSQAAVKAVRIIKYCAMAMIAFAAAGELIIVLLDNSDDRAGGVFIGLLIASGAIAAAAAAALVERVLQTAIDLRRPVTAAPESA